MIVLGYQLSSGICNLQLHLQCDSWFPTVVQLTDNFFNNGWSVYLVDQFSDGT